MPFEEISHTKINKKTGEEISKSSIKIYKKHLNLLAEAGFDTKKSLSQHQSEIIDLIDLVVDGDTSGSRALKRIWYSSIFYALDKEDIKKKQKFYDAFQKVKDNYVASK
jgi:hypothetical protein